MTFVVPTRNSARTLAACLSSIRAQQNVAVELIVVDNSSTDSTAQIGQRLADVVLQVGPERCAQRNAGAAAARSDVVVFIDSDMVVEPAVAEQVLAEFTEPALHALVLPELSFGTGFLARCRALEKQLYLGDSTVEAARAFRLSSFWQCGGWNESLTAAEDWDLTDRLAAMFGTSSVGRISSFVHHDEGRIALRDTFAKKSYYGQWLPAYRKSATSRTLVRTSLLSPRLLARPDLAAGLFTLKIVEAAGMARGARRAARAEVIAAAGSCDTDPQR